MKTIKTIATVLGFTALSAAATFSLISPSTTFADNPVQITAEGTKIGEVLFNGKIEHDASGKTFVAVTIENKSDKPQTATFQSDLQRTQTSMMARVPPMPMNVWNQKDSATLAAHAKITKRYEIPAAIAQQIAASEKDKPSAAKPMNPGMTVTYFNVRFEAPTA